MVDQKQKEKNTAILFSLCVCDSLPEYVARSVYYSSVMLRFPSRGVLLLFLVALGPLYSLFPLSECVEYRACMALIVLGDKVDCRLDIPLKRGW
jgi:hypothetical protein